MANPKTFTKQQISTTSDQDALQIKDVTGNIVGWIDATGTGQGNLASGGGSITGSGTNKALTVWTGSSSIGNSQAGTEIALDPVENLPTLTYGTVTDSLDVNGSSGGFLQAHSAFSSGFTAYCHQTTGVNNTRAASINLLRSNGTQSAPTIVKNGNVLGRVSGGGYDGTGYEFTAGGYLGTGGPSINFTAIGDWSATDHNGKISFFVNRVASSSSVVALVLNGDTATSAVFSGAVRAGTFTVAGLPTGTEGWTAYATNGRKVGEGSGAGTGVPVYFSNGSWRVYSTDAAVQS